jgi:hypothetical protein
MSLAEWQRLDEHARRVKHWRRWGPYLSERQWGTVREDYSPDGDAWSYLPYETALAYAYRWGEDGIAGWSDNHQRLCFALALWNGKDPFIKERLFGLNNSEGNHGEDVKEWFWHLDGTPTHSLMRYLYRYPQAAFPYEELRAENARRNRRDPTYHLIDTGIAGEDHRFFDVTVEYAKADDEDILIRVTAVNQGPEAATLHLLPTLWFRNDWSWDPRVDRSRIRRRGDHAVEAAHGTLGVRMLHADGPVRWLFTENETNEARLYGRDTAGGRTKDGINAYLVHGEQDAVGPDEGTKCAAYRECCLGAGESVTMRFRLRPEDGPAPDPFASFDEVFDRRRAEADAFHAGLAPEHLNDEERAVARHAFAGLLWTKQWYYYNVERWLEGDPGMPEPDPRRTHGRNAEWRHLYCDDILSMPDKWEFPWFAAWDSAFHAIPLVHVDPEFAKRQVTRFTREWLMHPNGQIPAYEWDFGDVNPPVQGWAAWRIYEMDRARTGVADTTFLESVFHKLLMNFTWWVNRKDHNGDNIFQGGFMGMDNIGVFDWSAPLPVDGHVDQIDSTAWVATFCLNMLRIAWELAEHNPAYEDIASKFFEHFLRIAHAMHGDGRLHGSLWDERDGFYYDQISYSDGTRQPLRLRSMVGLVPLLAVELLDYEQLDQMPGFKRRMDWFFDNRGDLTRDITCAVQREGKGRCLLALLNSQRISDILRYVLDENEFLSPYGVRSLSKFHEQQPYVFDRGGYTSEVAYTPGEAEVAAFGGNSNWRGPVWMPVNFLLIDALRKHHRFWGDTLKVECPTGSGTRMTLDEVADELTRRLTRLFVREDGVKPCLGPWEPLQRDPLWRDLPLFNEYFHGDTGQGLGASHQTGWTALVATLLFERGTGT